MNSLVATLAVRITTGVIAPAVINARDFTVSADALSGLGAEKPSVVLALKVNEKSMPDNIRVIRSINPRSRCAGPRRNS